MGSLIKEKEQNRSIFRELFFNSQKKLKDKFKTFKKNFKCNKCSACCKQKYIELPEDAIKELAKNEDRWAKFIDFFELTNEETEYTKRVRSKISENVTFYSCKYFDGKNCSYKGVKEFFCKDCGVNFEKVLPQECAYIDWQKLILKQISEEIFKDIVLKYKQMESYKDNFGCSCCATCCKFACSEFSFEELQQKASAGDRFASQFISVFKPYKDQNKAKEIYPEYVEMLEKKLGKDEKVYFYYCPHVDENNLCSIYKERPDICREFPNNPLSILPESCGYYQWKEEIEVLAMTLHALVSISEFYKERMENVI